MLERFMINICHNTKTALTQLRTYGIAGTQTCLKALRYQELPRKSLLVAKTFQVVKILFLRDGAYSI